jgi:metacaspase-1
MGRTKALLIGINYFGTKEELKGCINDAQNVQKFLVEDRGFSSDPRDMLVLTDAEENQGTEFWPSMENMLNAIKWLVNDNESGDSVWLSYSGHGGNANIDVPITSAVPVHTDDFSFK